MMQALAAFFGLLKLLEILIFLSGSMALIAVAMGLGHEAYSRKNIKEGEGVASDGAPSSFN